MLRRIARPALVTALALIACTRDIEAESKAERKANATKVTADSTHNATETIVNEDLRFRLAPPGPGWKVLREHDARSINPDAIAGAMHTGDGVFGILIVERLPGITLEQTGSWQEQLPEFALESDQTIEYQGLTAERRVFSAKIDGKQFYYTTTAFLRQEYLYQLMSWSAESHERPMQLAFHETFELLDGDIRGPSTTRTPITEVTGVGWRIHEGRYESALGGLRLRLPEGWRFLVGVELERVASDAEIAAFHEATNTFVSVAVTRASKNRLEGLAELTRRSFMDGHAPVGEPIVRELAGQRVEFRRYDAAPIEYQHGVYLGDDGITAVTAWCPQALRDDVVGPLDAVLSELERIPTDELATLREQLLSVPNTQRRHTADRTFRAGEFLDFEHQLRWTMPSGFWYVDSFNAALLRTAETVLAVSDLELGVHVIIEVSEPQADDPAVTLEAMIDGDELRSRDTVFVDALELHRAQAIDHTDDPPTHYLYAVTRRNQRSISLTAWSLEDSPAIQAAMQAALDGLDFAPALERTRIVGRQYTDLLHGFSFATPPGLDGPPQVQEYGIGRAVTWTQGQRGLVSFAMLGVTDNEAWMSSFIEQLVREAVGIERPLGKPERSEGLLGGRLARQLTWTAGDDHLHAQIIARDPLVYCMLYRNLTQAQREQVQASWTLLD